MRLSLLATVLLWIHTTESHEPGKTSHACVTAGNSVVMETTPLNRTSLGGFLTHVSLLATVLLWAHTTESYEPAGISPASVIVVNGVVMDTTTESYEPGWISHACVIGGYGVVIDTHH